MLTLKLWSVWILFVYQTHILKEAVKGIAEGIKSLAQF